MTAQVILVSASVVRCVHLAWLGAGRGNTRRCNLSRNLVRILSSQVCARSPSPYRGPTRACGGSHCNRVRSTSLYPCAMRLRRLAAPRMNAARRGRPSAGRDQHPRPSGCLPGRRERSPRCISRYVGCQSHHRTAGRRARAVVRATVSNTETR